MSEELKRDRILEVKKEFKKEFNIWAVTRQIFEISSYSIVKKGDIADIDYIQIGFSHIIKKGFFTEQKGSTYYDHKRLGSHYGKGLAFGEIKYIMNNYIRNKGKLLDIERVEIYNTLNKIINDTNINNLVILTSPANISKFVDIDDFILKNEGSLWGYYKDVPLYWTPDLSKNEFYIFNSNIGKLIIKTDSNINISNIDESEYDSIIIDIPEFNKEELNNYVRVKANEIVIFVLNNNINNVVQILRLNNTLDKALLGKYTIKEQNPSLIKRTLEN